MSGSITCERVVSMGHRLLSYDGPCSSPHGHNLRVAVQLDTTVFVDFKRVDASLARVLAPLDHAMVLEQDDPLLAVLRGMGFRTVALTVAPTTEALASYVFGEMLLEMAGVSGVEVESVCVHETDKYSALAIGLDPAVQRVG